MALQYYSESRLKALATKAPGAVVSGFPARFSDCQGVVYGGRGQRYDELQYLRNQNTDAANVNTKDSDAWNKFATGLAAGGVVGSRSDQEQREFFIEKNYP